MAEYREGGHTVYDIKYHLVWVTKYRYAILRGEAAVWVPENLAPFFRKLWPLGGVLLGSQ